MEDKTIKKEIDLGNDYSLLVFDDGSVQIVERVAELTEDMLEELKEALGAEETKSEKKPSKEEKPAKKDDKKKDKEPEPEGYTWADLKEMDEDELIDLIKENSLDTDPDDFDDNEAGLRKAIAKEIGVEVPAKKK